MRFKIQPDMSGTLCSSCREAMIVDYADGRREVFCHSRGTEPMRVRRPVVRCNDFDDRRTPAKWEMDKIAWVVTTDKSGKAIGFAPPPKDDDK